MLGLDEPHAGHYVTDHLVDRQRVLGHPVVPVGQSLTVDHERAKRQSVGEASVDVWPVAKDRDVTIAEGFDAAQDLRPVDKVDDHDIVVESSSSRRDACTTTAYLKP